jgi:outer membrane protein
MRNAFLFFALFSVCSLVNAQDTWSLERCLNHAKENNLSIKLALLDAQSSKKTLTQSKLSILPSLSSSVGTNYNFGKNEDPVTNQITTETVKNGNFSLSSSVNLFSGFQTINNIRKNAYDYLATTYDAENTANDVSVNIVTAYLQLLYNIELVKVNQQKLDLSELQVQRIQQMVEVGSLPRGNLLETESQYAQEELQLISSINQRDLALLNIKQLLDLKQEDRFEVIDPNLEPSGGLAYSDVQTIYEAAEQNIPLVKSADARLKSAQRSLAITQGYRSPSLTMFGSFGTAYSDAAERYFMDNNVLVSENYSLSNQLEFNQSQVVSFSLSIPIFDAWQTNTNVSKAKISVLQSQYRLEQTENELRKTIEQAVADASAADKQYVASQISAKALKEFYRYTEEKFNVDLINTYEFNDAKNRLFQAETDLLQAKYDYIFKLKMLDFYMGKQLTF